MQGMISTKSRRNNMVWKCLCAIFCSVYAPIFYFLFSRGSKNIVFNGYMFICLRFCSHLTELNYLNYQQSSIALVCCCWLLHSFVSTRHEVFINLRTVVPQSRRVYQIVSLLAVVFMECFSTQCAHWHGYLLCNLVKNFTSKNSLTTVDVCMSEEIVLWYDTVIES